MVEFSGAFSQPPAATPIAQTDYSVLGGLPLNTLKYSAIRQPGQLHFQQQGGFQQNNNAAQQSAAGVVALKLFF